MFDTAIFLDASSFIGAGIAIGFGAIGAALGEGYTAGMASEALSHKPESSGDVVKNMLVGQAIAESAAIFALVIAIACQGLSGMVAFWSIWIVSSGTTLAEWPMVSSRVFSLSLSACGLVMMRCITPPDPTRPAP